VFLNPTTLLGLGLVSIPIIIYLINRHRYQKRRWAAMEFLLRAIRRNQRRLQLQNLLLLLVRCAIIALLVTAIARPVLRRSAISILPGASQNWVLCLDQSFSMGYREESRTLFGQAKETIAQMFDGIIKPGDLVAVMTFGVDPRVIVPPTRVNDDARARILREVEDIRLAATGMDLGASFTVLDEVASGILSPARMPEPKQIVLFSDFQRKDWLRGEGPRDPTILPIMDKIQKEGGGFLAAKLSPADTRSNVAITNLEVTPALVATDVWVEVRASLTNFGKDEASNIDLTIEVDRNTEDASVEPQLGDVVRVPAGETVTRILPYRFSTAGGHTIAAELRSDGLAIDNRRFLVLDIDESIKVLLVDGEPATEALDRETFHIEAALEPEDDSLGAAGRFSPFETRTVTVDQLAEVSWSEYAVVVLANVGELPLDKLDELAAYVRSGGALMVFLGPGVRPEFYNEHFRKDEAQKMLPVPLTQVHGDKKYPVHLEIADADHPLPRYFEERKDATHLDGPLIPFYMYQRLGPIPEDMPGVRVSFRYTDSERSPAVIDNAYGEGRVLWVTSTADQEWNELSAWPDFVVFLYESISYLTRFGLTSSNLGIGETFRKTYPVSRYASEVMLLAPEAEAQELERARNMRKVMKGLPGGNEFEIVHEETDVPGLYRLDLLRPNSPGADTTEHFAVNVSTEESNLDSMKDDDFQAAYESFRYRAFDATERLRAVRGEEELLAGRELWKHFVWIVLGLAVAETVLACYFGRKTA